MISDILEENVLGIGTNFGNSIHEDLGESRSVAFLLKLWSNTYQDNDHPWKPFVKNSTLHSFFETISKKNKERHKFTFPNNSCTEDFEIQSIIQLKRAIDTIGISLDIKEETRKWIEEHPNVFQDIMILYRLRVYQVLKYTRKTSLWSRVGLHGLLNVE